MTPVDCRAAPRYCVIKEFAVDPPVTLAPTGVGCLVTALRTRVNNPSLVVGTVQIRIASQIKDIKSITKDFIKKYRDSRLGRRTKACAVSGAIRPGQATRRFKEVKKGLNSFICFRSTSRVMPLNRLALYS